MTKEELTQFLKEEYKRIEDTLLKLNALDRVKEDKETINMVVQDQFRDALMFLRHEKLDVLKTHLERCSKEKWV